MFYFIFVIFKFCCHVNLRFQYCNSKSLDTVNIINEFELNICRDIIFPKTKHIMNIIFLQDYSIVYFKYIVLTID